MRGLLPPGVKAPPDADQPMVTPMAKSTRSAASDKPGKPCPDFPLFPHNNGRWAKKVRKKLCYFGKWSDDPKGNRALNLWLDQKDDLLAGRKPRKADGDSLTVAELCDAFLNAKLDALHSDEITPRTFAEYHKTTDRIVDEFGRTRSVESLTPEDFGSFRANLAQTRGPTSLGNEIQRCRTVFKYSWDNRLIERPVHFGSSFNKPSAKAVRKARTAKGSQLFDADELRKIVKAADPTLRAMVLVAINCAYGATDIASMPRSALILPDGWADFPRAKTAVPRRAALWPETIDAIRAVLDSRATPRCTDDVDLVFLTRKGKRWLQESQSDDPKRWSSRLDLISRAFSRLLKAEGINGGRGFYCLRRTFQTVAEEQSGDFPAVSHVMGHAPRMTDMAATYRQRMSDERLQRVADAIRAWLFPAKGGTR